MYTILVVTALLLSLSIIGLVLLQHGRGADTGAAFGGGASGSLFGARGSATFLSRVTAIVVALFFLNCLALAWVVKSTPPEESIMGQIAEPAIERRLPEQEALEEPAATEPGLEADSTEEIPE